MTEPPDWKVVDCWCGPECWCACVLNPAGEEVVPYGCMSRDCCRAIVDAINGIPADHSEVFARYPLPWVAEDCGRGRYAIMTEKGVRTGSLEECICTAMLGDRDAKLMVDRVNEVYRENLS